MKADEMRSDLYAANSLMERFPSDQRCGRTTSRRPDAGAGREEGAYFAALLAPGRTPRRKLRPSGTPRSDLQMSDRHFSLSRCGRWDAYKRLWPAPQPARGTLKPDRRDD